MHSIFPLPSGIKVDQVGGGGYLLVSLGFSILLHLALLSCIGQLGAGVRARSGSVYLTAVIVSDAIAVVGLIEQQAISDKGEQRERGGQPRTKISDGLAEMLHPKMELKNPYVPPLSRYHSQSELDKPPLPLDIPSLDGPELSGTTQREQVKILVWVNAEGGVDKVETIAGNELFMGRVRKAFATARFVPGELHNKPVPSVVVVEVEYPELAFESN